MVAGEFAVLEPNHHLLVMAVDRFVYTKIQDHHRNVVTLKDFNLNNLEWKFTENTVEFSITDPRLSFVRDAITTVLMYLKENGIFPDTFSLTVNSELDDVESGLKYGLGSSAAVVTSIINAILIKFLPEPPSRKLLFKLAAISHIKTQGNGSGADIAASTYGGVINYTSFQAEWLKKELERESSIVKLVEKNWTYLSIEQIRFPQNLELFIGWTGSPASTGSLVSHIKSLKHTKPKQYHLFLENSEAAIGQILDGINQNNEQLFLDGIRKNRMTLSQIGIDAGVEIETEKLYKLSMAAEQFDGAGKLSGAGGGDCGIAFIPSDKASEGLYKEWIKMDIKPLNIKLYPAGSTDVILE